jgi:poly-gamma-glutamate synthesis protein (capsule biosynthesis protein)
VRVAYWGFDGRVHLGELMVNKDAVRAIETAMRALFAARFPIHKMVLVDNYGGSDPRSMHDNNSYAFGCAVVPGSEVWSQHSYGRAIDLNPIQNPEIRNGHISPPEGAACADRAIASKGMIRARGPVVRAFTKVGWTWGGNWHTLKDYMHFSANGW